MLRRLRSLLLVVICAGLGAAAGRVIGARRRGLPEGVAAGETAALHPPPRPPLYGELAAVRPQDLVPGLIAALRVGDRPWSYLHLPPWLAAFGVSLLVGAFRREVTPVLEALGLGLPGGTDSPAVAVDPNVDATQLPPMGEAPAQHTADDQPSWAPSAPAASEASAAGRPSDAPDLHSPDAAGSADDGAAGSFTPTGERAGDGAARGAP